MVLIIRLLYGGKYMRVKFLGTGTSTGNPEIGCRCEVCTSTDRRDNRLRCSVLVKVEDKQILIDCGPDFRQQIMQEEFRKMSGVLITHEHYDHVGGLDDLRPFCRFGDVDLYAEDYVFDVLRQRIAYCFVDKKYPGVPIFNTHVVEEGESFYVDGIKVEPIRVMHYKLPIFGYRIGGFAYLTDLKSLPESEYEKLRNLDVLVIDALRMTEHVSHESLDEALANIRRIAPKEAYLIHMSHQIGLHEQVQKTLPENVYLAYDGLEIEM